MEEHRPWMDIGILAHVDAGKTTLIESILYHTGKIKSFGRVDQKQSFLDHEAYERERGITIFSKMARTSFGKQRVLLMDTPGHRDFLAETERTLNALDLGILVISASQKIQPHTLTLWRLLRRYHIPTIFFVNKMDAPDTDRAMLFGEIKTTLSDQAVDFSNPGERAFQEEIAMAEEGMLEKYLEGEIISPGEIAALIQREKIFPCFFGSALKNQGIEELIKGIETYTMPRAYSKEFSGFIYKIKYDENDMRLAFLKITGGALSVKDWLGEEKVNQIRLYDGAGYEQTSTACAGDIVALPGILAKAGRVYGKTAILPPKSRPVLFYGLGFEEVVNLHSIFPKLQRIQDEFPELEISYDPKGEGITVRLMGQVQTEILTRLILDRLGLVCRLLEGRVIFQETIASKAEGVGHFEPLKHYAEVHLLLSPGEEGSGIRYQSLLSEDALAKSYQRQVEYIVTHTEWKGVLTGSTLTDVEVSLVAGRAHEKHTEGGDFLEAVGRALRQGLLQCENVLLEPFFDFVLQVPEEALGRAMFDLDQMQGVFTPPETRQGRAILKGYGPVRTLQNYAAQIPAYTRGQGSIDFSFRGYFPCKKAQEVLEEMGYDPLRDEAHPSHSLFCSHGEVFLVPWDQVYEYMHLPLQSVPVTSSEAPVKPLRSSYDEAKADSQELMEIFERTYGKVAPRVGEQAKSILSAPEKEYVYRETKKKKEYLLVDGYNVIFSAKELLEIAKINIDGARDRLIEMLMNLKGYSAYEIIVVFDAYKVQDHGTEILERDGIYIVYTKTAETADQYIERAAHEMTKKYNVTVATSDGVEQIIIRSKGAALLSSRDLLKELTRVGEEIRREYLEKHPSGKNRLFDSLDEATKETLEQMRRGEKK